MRPTVGLFEFLAPINTVGAEKRYACTGLLICYIRPPGDTRLLDANVTFVLCKNGSFVHLYFIHAN